MLISRCAWHPRYYGYSRLLGISNWRGLRIDFTDGICPKCAARVRVVRPRRAAGSPPAARSVDRTSEVVVVALAVLTGLVLIARPANEGAVPIERADLLPLPVAVERTIRAEVAPLRTARLGRPTEAPAPTVLVRRTRSAERLQSP